MTDGELLKLVEKDHLKAELTDFEIGDTIDVHVRITEGEKERIQIFTGTVIARGGSGTNAAFTVRRLVGSEGVERIFPLHAPTVAKIVVKKHGRVRRAKLYYLRDRVGKRTRVAEKLGVSVSGRGRAVPVEAAPVNTSAEAASQDATSE